MRIIVAALLLAAGAASASAADMCDTTADCADAATTIDMMECTAAATERADAELNRLWPEVLALYDGNQDPEADKATLKKAQNSWISFRDATCDAEQATADGGSIAGIYYEACECAVTASRIADFERMIGNRSEGN